MATVNFWTNYVFVCVWLPLKADKQVIFFGNGENLNSHAKKQLLCTVHSKRYWWFTEFCDGRISTNNSLRFCRLIEVATLNWINPRYGVGWTAIEKVRDLQSHRHFIWLRIFNFEWSHWITKQEGCHLTMFHSYEGNKHLPQHIGD